MGLDVGVGHKALVHLLESGSCGGHENTSYMHMVTGLTQSEKVDNLGCRNVFKIDRMECYEPHSKKINEKEANSYRYSFRKRFC